MLICFERRILLVGKELMKLVLRKLGILSHDMIS
jgi:hypothetical protein